MPAQTSCDETPVLKASGVRRARPWVLLYEQDPGARAGLVELLEDVGFAVWECSEPGPAVAAACSAPRLAALVINLKQGAEVADAVRQVQPGVRVLCLSSGPFGADESTDIELVGTLLSGIGNDTPGPEHHRRSRGAPPHPGARR